MHIHRNAAVKAPAQKRRPRSAPVEVVQVRPDVWATALKLADGDLRRIKILGPRKVEVLPAR